MLRSSVLRVSPPVRWIGFGMEPAFGARQRCRDRMVRAMSKVAAVRQRRVETRRQRDLRDQRAELQDAQQAVHQAYVIDVGRRS